METTTKTLPIHESSERYVDACFLAKKYTVSSRLILLMAADKRLPSLKIGNCVRFNEAAVARALEGSAE